jgi:hypothetical protein
MKCKESLIKGDTVERVAEKLTEDALTLSENVVELYGCSPERVSVKYLRFLNPFIFVTVTHSTPHWNRQLHTFSLKLTWVLGA